MQEFMQKRNSKQPLQYPSAGSFFKRPEGYFAGKLIQDAGLKGASVGGAQISAKHSGFMINRGGATADDILKLMHLVQNTVKDRFGVEMEPEVRIVGGPAEKNEKEGR
jgi:UDP-N-acetylmuramate dehydrogenase